MQFKHSVIALCFLAGSTASCQKSKERTEASSTSAAKPAEAETVKPAQPLEETGPQVPPSETVPEAPETAPPNPEASKTAAASIASVVVAKDCPDPAEKAGPKKGAPAQTRSRAKRSQGVGKGGNSGFAIMGPCTQSYVHIAFPGERDQKAKVAVKEVRLLSAKGDVLAILKSRAPSTWSGNGYVPWDETLAPGKELKGSYKLSAADWSAIESKLGSRSHGQMFSVEVDLEIAGQASTLRSPKFERSRPMNIRT